jgi:hypothetical protein
MDFSSFRISKVLPVFSLSHYLHFVMPTTSKNASHEIPGQCVFILKKSQEDTGGCSLAKPLLSPSEVYPRQGYSQSYLPLT